MTKRPPSLIRRVVIAFTSFRRILKDVEFARSVAELAADEEPPRVEAHATLAPASLEHSTTDSALLLLGLLQKEGRLIDFLHEEIKTYSDQEVGAAARVVHQGCQKILDDYLTISPVRSEPEGSRITLEPGFDSTAMRPTGNVVGNPPFIGALVHRGWRVTETRLPQVAASRNLNILAAAEVEL